MIIQKAGVIQFLRYLGIFCALTMGFFSIVATSEDDAADVLGIDTDFEDDFDLPVDAIRVEKTAQPAMAQTFLKCENGLSIQQGIDELNNSDLDDIDLDSVDLNYLEVRYMNATWETLEADSLTCWIAVAEAAPPEGETGHNTSFNAIPIVQNSSDWITPDLSDDNKAVMEYYLDNRNVLFNVCVVCDDDAGSITEFDVTVEANLDVKIRGSFL